MTIQRQYFRHLDVGLPGMIARPNEPYNILRGLTQDEVRPGMGVIYDNAAERWRLPDNDAERLLIDGVVGFNPTDFNADITGSTSNQQTRVVFAVGDYIKGITFGPIYVVAGATVKRGDGAIYNQTTERWIEYAPTAGTVADFRNVPMEFLDDAVDGETVAIRIHSKVRF